MCILLIEYGNRAVKRNAMPNIGASNTEDNLCAAFDKLNMITVSELLSGMEQLFSEFKVIHEQLERCKRPGLEYAYTMGDLYGLVLGMSGQYQAISDIVSKLPAKLMTEALQKKVNSGRAALKQVIQAWSELEKFFTNEVDVFRDTFYEVVSDGIMEQEEGSAGAKKDAVDGCPSETGPFSVEQMKWLRENLAKMGEKLSGHNVE